MIILPDRNIPRTRLLMPMQPGEWRQPSQREQCWGIENETKFIVKSYLDDGAVRWVGVFEDRDDVDAFLFAFFTGSLGYERELWRLPTPFWCPGPSDNLVLCVTTFLTSLPGQAVNFVVPVGWDNGNYSVEGISGGA